MRRPYSAPLVTCPHCQERVRMISGLVCPKCGHKTMVQDLDTDWDQFDTELGRKRAKPLD